VDYDEYRTGYRPDGVFFSGQSFIVKLGAGISSIIQGIVFSLVGFSGDNVARCNEILAKAPADTYVFATDPQFASYRFGMFFLISIPPAIGFILSVLPMRNYEISNQEHTEILDKLNEKRNKEAAE
ncbi:MAG: MFS transporter, partial [Acutalibacteraceae bacterium]